jgi:hypothetical protein
MSIKELKEETRLLYRSVGSLWCPAIKDNVVFNKHGWVHLSFRRNGHRRTPEDLRARLRLFKNVHEVVKNSKVSLLTSGTISSRRNIKRKASYYELVYLCGKQTKHTSVILRKIEDKKIHYYSVRRTNNRIKKALVKTGLI